MSPPFPAVRDCVNCRQPFRPERRGSWVVDGAFCGACRHLRHAGQRSATFEVGEPSAPFFAPGVLDADDDAEGA